jgi:NitT/TauT family transport system substrate-binding protein
MKKLMLTTVIAALAAFVLAGCGKNEAKPSPNGQNGSTPAAEAKADKLRIAYHPNMGGSSAIITGINKGFFKEQNIDIELVKFTSGPPEVAAMISGDIDAGYIGHGAHFLAVQGKVNILSLDVVSKSDEILVSKKAGISKIEDLKGKIVATQFGTSGDIVLELALKKAKMKKEDLKLVNMDMAGAVSAFIAGKVDAVAVWSPYTSEIKSRLGNDVLMLANNTDFKDEFVFPSSWVATPEYIKKNEDKLVRFMKGLHKAMDYRSEHLDEVVEMVAKLNNTPKESVVLEKDSGEWLTGKQAHQLFEDGTAKKWFEKQQELFLSTGTLTKSEPVDNYVAFPLMKKVK